MGDATEVSLRLRLREARSPERHIDLAGCDRVNPDWRQLQRHGSCKGLDGTVDRCQGRQFDHRLATAPAREQHDGPVRHHAWRRVFHSVVRSPEFDLEQLASTVSIEVDEAAAQGFGGHGHQMIDTFNIRERCPDRVLVYYVERDDRSGRAQLFLSAFSLQGSGLMRMRRPRDRRPYGRWRDQYRRLRHR